MKSRLVIKPSHEQGTGHGFEAGKKRHERDGSRQAGGNRQGGGNER